MSGQDRRDIRALALAALAADPYLAAFTQISAWAQTVDVSALPAWAVATPRETRDRQTQDTDMRDLTVAVVIKRAGGDDIEDRLDDDADAIEAAVTPALRSDIRQCELVQSEIKLDGDGARRVGTLAMTFSVTYWVNDPV